MNLTVLKSKIHRANVTEANLYYEGSITIDKDLMDAANIIEGEKIEIFFNDTASPALIKDPSDFDSIFVIMPMKG